MILEFWTRMNSTAVLTLDKQVRALLKVAEIFAIVEYMSTPETFVNAFLLNMIYVLLH